MKKISLLLIAIFSLLAFNNAKAQSCPATQGEKDCANNYDGGSSSIPWNSTYDDITLPDWPSCTLRVFYCYRQTSAVPHTTQKIITSFATIGSGCSALNSYLGVSNLELAQRNAVYVEQQAMQVLMLNDFNAMWAVLTPTEKEQYICPTSPGSHDPNLLNWKYRMNYYQGTCFGYCRTLNMVNNNYVYTLTKRNCANDYCCIVKLAYCVESPITNPPTLRIMKQFSSDAITQGQCQNFEIPLSSCPTGLEVTTLPCKTNCQEFTK